MNWFKIWVIGLLAITATAQAANNSWTPTVGGRWEIGANWSTGAPPNLTHSGIFITNGVSVGLSKTITIDAATVLSNAMNGCMTISNLTLSALGLFRNTLFLNNAGSTTPLRLVNALTLTSGGLISVTNSALRVEGNFNNDGTVVLNTGSIIASNSSSSVGNTGVGQMTVFDGTSRSSSLTVGNLPGSLGTLTWAGGTNIVTSAALNVGFNAGTTGTIWMVDGLTILTNCLITIGNGGVGRMTVSNGTCQVSMSITVGNVAGSQGTLTIAGGSNLLASASSPAQIVVGSAGSSSGTVWMTGGNWLLTNATTIIGNAGVGQMIVSNGVYSAGTVTIGALASGRGTLTVAGGTNVLGGELRVGHFANATGTVWKTGGLLVTTNQLTYVGLSGRGEMIVSNGLWLAREIRVGESLGGRGTLTFAGGTNVVNTFFLILGSSANITGTVWLTGGQLITTNASINVGSLGVGQMTVSNGTWLGRNMTLATVAGGRGTLTVAGGVSSVYSSLAIGRSDCTSTGIVNSAGGELNITNAAGNAQLQFNTGTLTLSSGTLTVDRLIMTNVCGQFFRTGGTLIYGSAVLNPASDSDGDGLSNGWEQQYGLDPLDATGDDGASGDPDGDGLTNAEEFSLGTNPKTSDFRITAIAREGNDIRITWRTFGGKTDRVLVSKGAADGSFTTNFSNLSPLIIIPGSGVTSTNYLDVGGATNTPSRYYRVGPSIGGARFLFDAGHAETAGNADWIIDADTNNISWNNAGTFTLTGNDSNAQRIPTPAASGIISNTAETYWNGGISAWAVDLVKRGHSVETLPAGATFTYNTANSQDLTNYNVVVVNEPNILFTLVEKQALLSFVTNGGSLFLIADHTNSDRNNDGEDSPIIWMDFLTNNLVTNNPFGIVFPSSTASGVNTFNHSIVGDPILNGPVGLATNVTYFSGNRFQVDHTKNPTVTSHMWFGAVGDSNNLCAVASLRYGNGRVVVCGDSSPFDDGTGDPGDGLFNDYTGEIGGTNRIWILNASEWLAAPFP